MTIKGKIMANNISNNRICFFDKTLVDDSKTTAMHIWHKPTPTDIVFKFDKKWEEKGADVLELLYENLVD